MGDAGFGCLAVSGSIPDKRMLACDVAARRSAAHACLGFIAAIFSIVPLTVSNVGPLQVRHYGPQVQSTVYAGTALPSVTGLISGTSHPRRPVFESSPSHSPLNGNASCEHERSPAHCYLSVGASFRKFLDKLQAGLHLDTKLVRLVVCTWCQRGKRDLFLSYSTKMLACCVPVSGSSA